VPEKIINSKILRATTVEPLFGSLSYFGVSLGKKPNSTRVLTKKQFVSQIKIKLLPLCPKINAHLAY
jgi:hypothetical protein